VDVFKSFHERVLLGQEEINKKSISIDVIEIKQSAVVAQAKINSIFCLTSLLNFN